MIPRVHSDDDDDIPADKTEVTLTPTETAVRWGLVLPFVMLKRALGSRLGTFRDQPSLCVAIHVPSIEWVEPVLSASKLIGSFGVYLDTSVKPHQRDALLRDFSLRVASGQRSLFLMSGVVDAFTKRVAATADIHIDLDRIEVRDLSTAIRLATGQRARGLIDEDAIDLELLPTMAAIRAGTSAKACIARLRAAKATRRPDPLVASAPLLEDLHGYGKAKEWGLKLIDEIDRWRGGELSMAEIQRNAVLVGPPGVGKSIYARSLARSTGLPLVVTSLGTLFSSTDGYLGGIIKGIDAAFAEARAAGPAAILFIDELDAVGSRDRLDGKHDQWWINVINHMLTTLDGALSRATANLVVLAATNHVDRIDPAILRPGRLDRVIQIDPPEVGEIPGILRHHLGPDLPDADLRPLADVAAGATGAELAGLVKSARAAARAAGHPLRMQDLVAQACPPSTANADERWRICIHEAGHIIAALRLRTASVRSVSIATRVEGSGVSGGHVVFESSINQLSDARQYRNVVVQLLAGRAAEIVVLGSASGGAGGGEDSDLGRASAILATNHLSLGLGDTLFNAAEPGDALKRARQLPALMARLEAELQELHAAAKVLIDEESASVLALAKRLSDDRVLSGADVNVVLSQAGFGHE